MSTRNRVGLFGGTFNPIHMGHLRVAEEALRQCGLKKVIFLPTGHPPHREVAEGVPNARVVMDWASAHHVDLPICAGVYQILHQGADPKRVLAELMALPPRWEADGTLL